MRKKRGRKACPLGVTLLFLFQKKQTENVNLIAKKLSMQKDFFWKLLEWTSIPYLDVSTASYQYIYLWMSSFPDNDFITNATLPFFAISFFFILVTVDFLLSSSVWPPSSSFESGGRMNRMQHKLPVPWIPWRRLVLPDPLPLSFPSFLRSEDKSSRSRKEERRKRDVSSLWWRDTRNTMIWKKESNDMFTPQIKKRITRETSRFFSFQILCLLRNCIKKRASRKKRSNAIPVEASHSFFHDSNPCEQQTASTTNFFVKE